MTNEERARAVEHAVLSYCLAKERKVDLYDPLQDVLGDFLTDLHHFALSEGIDPQVLKARFESSARMFQQELEEDQ